MFPYVVRMEKMAVVHFTAIQCGPNKAHKSTKKAIFNFAMFVPLLTTLCMLGLKVFVRFYESSVLKWLWSGLMSSSSVKDILSTFFFHLFKEPSFWDIQAVINKFSHFLGFTFYIEIAAIHLSPAGQTDSQVVAKNRQDELELGGQTDSQIAYNYEQVAKQI